MVAHARWFGGKGRQISGMRSVDELELGDVRLVVVEVAYAAGESELYAVGLPREDGLVAALGTLLGRGEPVQSGSGTFSFERGPGYATPQPGERPVGVDQSNSSVVLGESQIVKLFRRLEPGPNPDVELSRYLGGRVGFASVPAFAGAIRWRAPTGDVYDLALAQEYVPGSEDCYEATAAALVALTEAEDLRPALATAEQDARSLGEITAGLHAALVRAKAPGLRPRWATGDDLALWRQRGEEALDRALGLLDGEAAAELGAWAPWIREELAGLERQVKPPLLTRVHGDLHLGQVLRSARGFLVIDFEGDPTRSLAERRLHGSPLRDVACMLRSFDHVARSAMRRAGGGEVRIERWLTCSRGAFLDAYVQTLAEQDAPFRLETGLVRAFELEKECSEYVYAATYLPSWLFVPRASMRALAESGARA